MNKMILFEYIIIKRCLIMQISDEDVRLVLSQNIKSARSSIGYTQEKLAEKSEISSNFLKDIENQRSGISLTTLINLCKSLKTTPNQVLKDFFKDSTEQSDNILQQINLLDDYEKRAVLTLIDYFIKNNHNQIISD